MGRITKRAVDGIERDGHERWLWDTSLPGFGLRVKPSGVRSYLVQYRNLAGRTRRLTLGKHGQLTPDQARQRAAEALALVAAGRDPAEEKREARREAQVAAERTVEAVGKAWIAAMEQRASAGKVRARTVAEYKRQLETEILPRLGRRELADLRAADARALQKALGDRPVLANRVLSLLSQLWRWAFREGLVSGGNPTHGVEPFPEHRRETHFARADLGKLGKALHELETEKAIEPRIASLVKLVAFTGCRPGEIKGLAWDAVDTDRRVLRVRGGKTGDRSVWLNGPALSVLRGLRPVDGSPWCFPSPRDRSKPLGEFRKAWSALLTKAELEAADPYALRHTFASESEAAGNSLLVTAALLGHAQGRIGGMTAVYVHHVPEDVRRASERVGRRIAQALEGGAPAKVVDIRGRA